MTVGKRDLRDHSHSCPVCKRDCECKGGSKYYKGICSHCSKPQSLRTYVAINLALATPAMEEWRKGIEAQEPGRVVEIRVTIDSVEKEFTLEDFKERLGF